MVRRHEARPNGVWADDGSGLCAICEARIIEAVYSGGWLHSLETPHPFKPFFYSDGTKAPTRGCLDCGHLPDAPIHSWQSAITGGILAMRRLIARKGSH